MPYPDDDFVQSSNNHLITEELDYDIANLHNEFRQLLGALTNEQRVVYDEVITAVQSNQGVFFVYGYGGTGKTFLWKTLSASIRSIGEIVLNVASNGIASLLLTGGRISHTRFQIPLILNEDSLCYIKPDSDVAKLIKKTRLIIWDEAPMVHQHAFEALDISMNDVFGSQGITDSEMLFEGKHEVVQEINDLLLSLFLGDEKEYLSSDSLCESEHLHEQFDETLYSPDVLNGLKLSGLPNHKIVLKVDVPVMLLRNIDQKSGLCNGTRLRVLSLGNRVIEAYIISGSNIGNQTFIPRMSLTPTNKRIPFKF
ncbi:hypothetical protein L6452_22450 [Arctium lappa]|uniref:Uncharacterized protein n=1 Tax=Arctium lappa TaxID=4217 RepID=A0ACB9B061_ARCLA|nr:hypothetical protein L6452_22450 [Arctium lappa]